MPEDDSNDIKIGPTMEQIFEAAERASERLHQERLQAQASTSVLLQSTLKLISTINGGGSVALLAFAGHVYTSNESKTLMTYIVISLILLILGLVSAVSASYFSFISVEKLYHSKPHPDNRYAYLYNRNNNNNKKEKEREEEWRLQSNNYGNISLFCGILSTLFFLAGVAITACGLINS